jgi:hypothetical protein
MFRACAVIAATLALGAVLAVAQCPGGGCQPWTGVPCARSDQWHYVNFKARQRYNSTEGWMLSSDAATYGFKPSIDQLQAFRLEGFVHNVSGWLGTTSFSGNFTPTVPTPTRPVEVAITLDNAGNVSMPSYPLIDHDTTVTAAEVSDVCGPGHVALASFLVVNITMTDGVYKWAGSNIPPIQVGFDPTCKEGSCVLGSGHCIGRPGRQNCAKCIPAVDVLNRAHKIDVWMAYYGSDSNGRSFRSGSENPLNFEEFAFDPVFNSVVDSINKN